MEILVWLAALLFGLWLTKIAATSRNDTVSFYTGFAALLCYCVVVILAVQIFYLKS